VLARKYLSELYCFIPFLLYLFGGLRVLSIHGATLRLMDLITVLALFSLIGLATQKNIKKQDIFVIYFFLFMGVSSVVILLLDHNILGIFIGARFVQLIVIFYLFVYVFKVKITAKYLFYFILYIYVIFILQLKGIYPETSVLLQSHAMAFSIGSIFVAFLDRRMVVILFLMLLNLSIIFFWAPKSYPIIAIMILLFLLFSCGRYKVMIFLLIIFLLIAPTSQLLVNNQSMQRMSSAISMLLVYSEILSSSKVYDSDYVYDQLQFSEEYDESLARKIPRYNSMINQIKSEPWLIVTGAGLGSSNFLASESTVIQVIVEFGLIGIGILVLWIRNKLGKKFYIFLFTVIAFSFFNSILYWNVFLMISLAMGAFFSYKRIIK
jgi:hypothetical protein